MTVIIDGGAGVTFPDTVQQTNGMTMTGGNPQYYAARAWVNFNGVGTVAIRSAVNVSSITDLGSGTYRVNMTTAMPDANYAVVGSGDYTGTATTPVFNYDIVNSSGVTVELKNGPTGAALDNPSVSVAIFR